VNERLRIGDAERETAAHELGEHYAMGRITTEEHSARLEQIWAARTAADLAPAFADLPRPPKPDPVTASPRRQWSGRSAPRVPFLVKLLIALVVVVLVFTHLPWVLVALLVYLVFLRRFAHHRHPRNARWR
jgi:Flp pilus assembly protein TadB